MGKAKRLKRMWKWEDGGFAAALSAGLTENFQRQLRQSELWDQIVAEFGKARAEEILRECKAEVKPRVVLDGSGHRPTHLP
jgi:hypothetical protein